MCIVNVGINYYLFKTKDREEGIFMLRIAICDDEKIIIDELYEMINTILHNHYYDNQIMIFQNGEGVLEEAEKIDIVFMDIEMPDKDGLQLGQELKERNPKCKIIMATGMVERFKEAFQIRAHRFVTKPFDKEEVEEALISAIDECNIGSSIEVYCQRNRYNILQEDIQYVEAYNGYTEFEVDGNRFRKEVSLMELENMLSDTLFVRVDRKYMVNLRYVQSYMNDKFMIGEKAFSISRRNRKDFERKYIEYDLRYRRRYT